MKSAIRKVHSFGLLSLHIYAAVSSREPRKQCCQSYLTLLTSLGIGMLSKCAITKIIQGDFFLYCFRALPIECRLFA